jgi:hypothetical protein
MGAQYQVITAESVISRKIHGSGWQYEKAYMKFAA